MAYDFTRASSQYITTGSTPVTEEPFTLSAWFYRRTNASPQMCLVTLDAGTNASLFKRRTLLLITASNIIGAAANDGTGGVTSQTTATYNLNEWNHGCAVFGSSTSRTAYLNGIAATENTVERSNPTGIADICIGHSYNLGVAGSFLDGLAAEVGMWNVALTAQEVASLAKGFACNRIRPQSLVFYAPLRRNLVDAKGRSVTGYNGPTVTSHPRIYA